MSDPPLPDVDDGSLDDAGLDALSADLTTLAEDLEVRVKATPGHSAPGDLRDALDALRAGAARAVQVSYRYQGRPWIDTILRAPDGWRVVRISPQV